MLLNSQYSTSVMSLLFPNNGDNDFFYKFFSLVELNNISHFTISLRLWSAITKGKKIR